MSDVKEILEQWNKDSGAEVAHKGLQREILPSIPFSSATANYMTYGGIPRRRMHEFFGAEGSGKTTSALDIVANAQYIFKEEQEEQLEAELEKLEQAQKAKKSKKIINIIENKIAKLQEPKKCIYVDLENTLDRDWAMNIGVDVDSLIIITPEDDTAETILQNMLDLLATGEVGLMVMDSIPYLIPQGLYEEDLSKKSYGGISAVMADFCRKSGQIIKRTGTTLILINQVRDVINSQFPLVGTPGGRALKHAYAVRLMFDKGSLLDEEGKEMPRKYATPSGNIVNIKVEKTKSFKPNRRIGSYTINYTRGIDVEADLLDMAVSLGFIVVKGSWHYVIDPEDGEILEDSDGEELKTQGRSNMLKKLRDSEELYDTLMAQVHEELIKE